METAPSMPFPELLRALQTSGLVFLADLCYVKCPNGFHGNTPEASSKQSSQALPSSLSKSGKEAQFLVQRSEKSDQRGHMLKNKGILF